MRAVAKLALVIGLLIPSAASATEHQLTVDQSLSAVDVELCINAVLSVCDSDSTPVTGSITLDVPCPLAPASVTLHDFEFATTQDVVLHLDFSIFGLLDATAQNVVIRYANPGTPMPPTPLAGDMAQYVSVPVTATGQLTYVATSAVCSGLMTAGMECGSPGNPAVLDLSTFVLDPVDLVATLSFPDTRVVLASALSVSGPLLDTVPDLGTFSANGSIVADEFLDAACCDVDMTGGDAVNLTDHFLFAGCLAGPGNTVTGGCRCADIDGDDDVDLSDFAELQVAVSSQ